MFIGRALRFLFVALLCGSALGGLLVMLGAGVVKAPEAFQEISNLWTRQRLDVLILMVVGYGMLMLLVVVFAPILGLPITLIYASMAAIWIAVRGRCPAPVVVATAFLPACGIIMVSVLQDHAHNLERIVGSLLFAGIAASAGLASREITIRLGYMPR
jgi:hypothetical protein